MFCNFNLRGLISDFQRRKYYGWKKDTILKLSMPNHLRKGMWEHYTAASISRHLTILYLLEWKVMPITQRLLKVTVMKLILFVLIILDYSVDRVPVKMKFTPLFLCHCFNTFMHCSAFCSSSPFLVKFLSRCAIEGLNASVKEIEWWCMIHLWIHNSTRFYRSYFTLWLPREFQQPSSDNLCAWNKRSDVYIVQLYGHV